MEAPLKLRLGRTLLISLLTLPVTVNAQSKAKNSNPYQLTIAGQTDYMLISSQSRLRTKTLINPTVPAQLSVKPYAREIEAAARASELDPVLVHALIHVESRHQSSALSNKGAVGLMQVLPETALRFGIQDPENPGQNLLAGTRYLRSLLDMFDQRVELALAAYNAGEGAVLKYGNEIPPYAETQHYVPAVLDKYEEWRPGKQRVTIRYMPGTRLDLKSLKSSAPIEKGAEAPLSINLEKTLRLDADGDEPRHP